MKPGLFSKVAAVALLLVAGGVLFWSQMNSKTTPPTTTQTSASSDTNQTNDLSPITATRDKSIETTAPERLLGEIRYLPDTVKVPDARMSLVPPGFTTGTKLLTGTKALTDKEKDGEFLNPRWSPDGLSVLLSRPGFDGVFILDPATGDVRKISDENGYRAKWTDDGRISVTSDHGTTYLNPDGSPAESGSDFAASVAYADGDMIYITGADGQAVPITGTEDRFFNPVTSPDGRYVAYQGLVTGFYIAPTDGSAPPQWVGRGGNPSWLPDSSGVVFDRTTDDGHHLNSGDLLLLEIGTNRISNLTINDDAVIQMPNVSPNGRQIIYEVEGQVVVGSLQ
jgi:Tol biopolymer transport system component